MATTKRIFSGIQPTGIPHIGNYFGALQKWAKSSPATRQEALYCIVDWHAITVPYEKKQLKTNVYDMAASMLACGIDPEKVVFFRQSAVKQHTELHWMLGCFVPNGWLQRMTQYKQKSAKQKENSTLGLLSYPVLMAADMLLYKATHVPVGDDQIQHLELARMIATTFNDKAGSMIFPKPQPVIEDKHCSRVLSLTNPTVKMSKSDEASNSRILLTDSADEISKKIRKAQTDSIRGISFNLSQRPGVSNLLGIYSAVQDLPMNQIVDECKEMNMKEFKGVVTDALVDRILPIGQSIRQYQSDYNYLEQIFADGAEEAREIAAETMKQVNQVSGF